MTLRLLATSLAVSVASLATFQSSVAADPPDGIARIQTEAIRDNRSPVAHWGTDPGNYMQWATHSNRLIPVYAFGTKEAGEGIDLESYAGENSIYRDEERLKELYGRLPEKSLNPEAEYLDQTDLFRLQQEAFRAGKKRIIVVVFDGMDWQTSRAAAIYASRKVGYDEGRGEGLFFQEYDANGTSQFGYVVTDSKYDSVMADVDNQSVAPATLEGPGGYSAEFGGTAPWSAPKDPGYLIGQPKVEGAPKHPYPDSAATATSIFTGVKTYNAAIGVDDFGVPVASIAHELQRKGWSVGAVSSVPVSHATPASTYAHNVSRDDYQDLSRDMVGRPSIAHPAEPLPGMDVVLGAGHGVEPKKDNGQGKNFVAGNRYLPQEDLDAIDVANGGKYAVAQRTAGRDGTDVLKEGVKAAIAKNARLFGFFGTKDAHLPFRTANGDYRPVPGRTKKAELYSAADVQENPTLREMAVAALSVLSRDEDGFWLMVEAGDVDWANHDDNLDNSIGAVLSGDDAVRGIAEWVEANGGWEETILLVTADHGHSLYITEPQAIADAATAAQADAEGVAPAAETSVPATPSP
ncbi:MAG TPA: alkaline phosphatase [Pirellulaceae bacterium]|jgi:alkaline phosphatase|nr:alkaline phosphatase [Pirellulaceae bacterium]